MARQPVALVAVPDAAAVLRDPGLVDQLPTPVLAAVWAEIATAERRVLACLLARAATTAPASTPDRALNTEEAADLMKMSRDFVYRNWPKLGGYKDVDGHVKFALSAVQKHIRQRTGR